VLRSALRLYEFHGVFSLNAFGIKIGLRTHTGSTGAPDGSGYEKLSVTVTVMI